MDLILPLLFFYKHDFCIEFPTKIDVPLNKGTRQKSDPK